MILVLAVAARNIRNAVIQNRMTYFILVLISAFLSAGAFYYNEFFIFFSLTPFLYVLFKTEYIKKRFLLGYIWGLVYFACLCYWLIHVSWLGLVLLTLYLGCYPALFAVLCKPKNKFINIYYVSGLWVILDFLRSFLSFKFAWGYFGYALSENKVLIQIADLTGVHGVSFIVVLVNCLFLYFITKVILRKKILHSFVLLAIFVCSFVYGNNRLKNLVSTGVAKDVALIQTNVNSNFKWDLSFYQDNLERFELLVHIAKHKGAKLIISPESILPFPWGKKPSMMQRIQSVAKETKTPLLLGIPFYKNNQIYNSSLFLTHTGEVKDVYFKVHLVPFGEYMPLRRIFLFLENIYPIGSYSRGDSLKLFDYMKHRFSILICYEDIPADIIRRATVLGAHFFVNQSDEGWFKETKEMYLHNQIAVFRAIENRRSIVRSTNTGLSCFIDYKGNVIEQLEPFKADVLVADVPIYTKFSFYSKYSWLFIWILLIGVVIYLFSSGIRRNF
ncbi:MAG: apolipoprotein N-acyltransferase [Candidatus Saelkia tenebricola]|nr:apolipoprotein N-acyltransferase [Candidatus Saelkia tenebricola]